MRESQRIQSFRESVIKRIPIFPNNRDTRNLLHNMPLNKLMIHALSWLSRFVNTRRRHVHVANNILDHHKWKENQYRILPLLRRFQKGESVIEFLSEKIEKRGLNLNFNITNKWEDKDFLLNAMGFHHFHLGDLQEGNTFADRTNDILFAEVKRKEVSVIGIYEHSVFDSKSATLSKERQRLWADFESYRFGSIEPGKVYLQSMIATSGHPMHIVTLAKHYTDIIYNLDDKLNDQKFLPEFLGIRDEDLKFQYKFDWTLHFSDLYLIEKNQNLQILIGEGFN